MNQAEVVPELAGPGDLAALAVTCATAFRDDSMIRWPMPEATPQTLAELFRVILDPYIEFGTLWKVCDCDGAAAWLPPSMVGRFDGNGAVRPGRDQPADRRRRRSAMRRSGTGWAITCPASPAGSSMW